MKKDLKETLIKLFIFTFLGMAFYTILSSLYYNLGIIMLIMYIIVFATAEIIYFSRIKKIKVFSKKGSSLFIIAAINLILMFAIFGFTDYIRTVNGRAPIFTYWKISVSNVFSIGDELAKANPPNKTGTFYEGVGYKVTICDDTTENYRFQLGYKEGNLCQDYLSCSKIIDKNNEKYIEYSFFDNKLEYIHTRSVIPTDQIKDVKTYKKEFNEINMVDGCAGIFEKINDTTYKTIHQCFFPRMNDVDVHDIYGTTKESLEEQTRESIIEYYAINEKDMKCE